MQWHKLKRQIAGTVPRASEEVSEHLGVHSSEARYANSAPRGLSAGCIGTTENGVVDLTPLPAASSLR